jgi:hypothetical protein
VPGDPDTRVAGALSLVSGRLRHPCRLGPRHDPHPKDRLTKSAVNQGQQRSPAETKKSSSKGAFWPFLQVAEVAALDQADQVVPSASQDV